MAKASHRVVPAVSETGVECTSSLKDAPSTSSQNCPSVMINFRPCAGCSNVFRGCDVDNLGSRQHMQHNHLSAPDRWVLYDATLILDLRMECEIDTSKVQTLIHSAPGGAFTEIRTLEEMMSTSSSRQYFRPTGKYCLTRESLAEYALKNWVPLQQWQDADASRRKELVMEALSLKGLVGLYEIILETKLYISTVLQAITIHLERNPTNGQVIYYCSLGKDRTGMISMLLSYIQGVDDTEITRDFACSRSVFDISVKKFAEFFHNKVDPSSFAHADEDAMEATMKYLRTKYGSIEAYLVSTGFDSEWQTRCRNALSAGKTDEKGACPVWAPTA